MLDAGNSVEADSVEVSAEEVRRLAKKAYMKAYHLANPKTPEQAQRAKELAAQWVKDNPERRAGYVQKRKVEKAAEIKAYAAAHYKANKAIKTAQFEARKAADPEKYREMARKSTAKNRASKPEGWAAAQYALNADDSRLKGKKYREIHGEKMNAAARARRAENPEKAAAYEAAYRAANPVDKVAQAAHNAARYLANKEAIKAQNNAWHAANPQSANARTSRKRAAKLQRSVAWDCELTELVDTEAAHLCMLREKATGFKWETDHVLPLQGRLVSGFHLWSNLAVIPQVVNRQKSNKFEVA